MRQMEWAIFGQNEKHKNSKVSRSLALSLSSVFFVIQTEKSKVCTITKCQMRTSHALDSSKIKCSLRSFDASVSYVALRLCKRLWHE